MKTYIGIAFLYFITIKVYSQCPSTVYVRDVGKYGRVESCQKDKGETLNMVVSFHTEETYRYGKWRSYYSNGKLREEGFITLESSMNTMREPDRNYRPRPYMEKRIGKWLFWDEEGNRTEVMYH